MKVILYLLGDILYFISYLIPKSSAIWVFGSWGGKEFADNPKYLYNYIKYNNPEIKTVWLTRNPILCKKLKKDGHTIFMCNSFKGIWYSCRAKIGVTSHGMIDLNRFACARLKIVQTWHGIPLKPVLLSDPKKASILKRKKLQLLSHVFLFLKKELNFNDNLVICSSSDYVTTILKLCFGEKTPLKNSGFPRLDGLFKPNSEYAISQRICKLKKQGKKIGIYMPTYRSDGEFDIISLLVNNFSNIEENLVINNQVLFLKIHPFEYYKIQNLKTSENIQFIINDEIEGDIYSILGFFDFLVSDYSSIIFDYLILSRPIYLLVPDRKQYITSNGNFVYDYVNIGLPVYENWDQLLDVISKPFLEVCPEKIKVLSQKFHTYRDGDSSRRLYEYVIKKL
jgi:CDP-glycerol glycerophosphotransferase (TagB/SpsB family)